MLRRGAEENIGFTGVNIFLNTFKEKIIIFTAIKNQSILRRRVMAVI